jgi:hypothetical protein
LHPDNKEALNRRVVQAAEAALADHGYVSAIDVLTGMKILSPAHVEIWRRGRLDFLERLVQGNLKKISLSMSFFRQWARGKGLCPSETRYMRWGRGAKLELRFSKSGDPEIERHYRTHFVSPDLSGIKRKKLED